MVVVHAVAGLLDGAAKPCLAPVGTRMKLMADEGKLADATGQQVLSGKLAHQKIVRPDARNILVGNDPADADPGPVEHSRPPQPGYGTSK